MAKTKQKGLAGTLHARGLRKRVARTVEDAVGAGRSAASPKLVTDVVDELRSLAGDLEDMVSGGDSKRTRTTRRTAAKKAARTRSEQAAKRSAAARKAARTRAARASKAGAR